MTNMPIQIIPKNTQTGAGSLHRAESILMAAALTILLLVGGAYALLQYVFESSQEKKNTDSQKEFKEAGGAEQRQTEEKLIQYQGKIGAVQGLILGQKNPIPMLKFLEKYTLRDIAFSSAEISVAEGKMDLAGKAPSFAVLHQQILLMENIIQEGDQEKKELQSAVFSGFKKEEEGVSFSLSLQFLPDATK